MFPPNKFSGYQAGIRLYRGKGGDVAAPDPALVAAQIKSMGIQDDAIKGILANTNDLAPLQKEQLQFGLDSARLGQKQSQEDRTWATGQRGKLTTLQNRMSDEAASFNTEDRANQLSGQAGADVSQAISSAREQGSRAQSRMGVDPNSGRALAMGNSVDIAGAAAKAGAMNGARTSARIEGRALQDRAMGGLSGSPGMGMQATAAGAGYGMSGIGAVNSALAGMNSGYGAAGGLAGSMGQNATSMYSTQGQMYQADQNAQAAGASSTGAAIGGIAMAFI